ncbi:hypothetical protein D9758_018566 [Tetrapyrgos nigripes]|uniref:Uncharacterized protein n=1 Tax=Tetrapyrgos nigripes TaxID=182062 RepID=A0A8H5ETG0_9AGAR|nr:hypothetical protein D9758_018566 [Tetrapyrgos nigripes]
MGLFAALSFFYILHGHYRPPEVTRSLEVKLLGMRMIPLHVKEWIAVAEGRTPGPMIPLSSKSSFADDHYNTHLHSDQSLNPSSESIYVINLPDRSDRRAEIELLRIYMGMKWTYVDATSKNDIIVSQVIQNVKDTRRKAVQASLQKVMHKQAVDGPWSPVRLPFRWPAYFDNDYALRDLDPSFLYDNFDALHTPSSSLSSPSADSVDFDSVTALYLKEPLAVARKDSTLWPYNPSLPRWKIMTRSRFACWHSHLQTLRRIVAAQDITQAGTAHEDRVVGDHVSIILEDDIDMEVDIRSRLGAIWPHCL